MSAAGTRAEAAAFLGVERSATGKRWASRVEDDRLALALAQRHGLPELLARVLAARKVSLEDAPKFLEPTLRGYMPDPSVLRDMDAAAERVAKAIQGGESVAVFGDYDVDGATSSALLVRYFRAVGASLRFYIPDRIREGYGPNAPALLRLKKEGVRLVITVDCGTMAHKALGQAKEAGLNIVVLDHHQAEHALPPTSALVNPNRLDDESGLGQLAAVGVTFLFIVALNRVLRDAGWFEGREAPDLMQWLDLVALGTVCDVVPLTGLNRAFVAQGLKIMARRQNAGLVALSDVARLEGLPNTYHAGFLLGPRVNAGGRVGRADFGTRLLSTEDAQEAMQLAQELDSYNKERQVIEAEVLEDALGMVEARLSRERRNTLPPLLVAAGEGWHPGVIGIVASRLKDHWNRPSFVIAIDKQGEGKGSGRSVPGVDMGRAVTAALEEGLLVNGGGHAMAAGLTVKASKIEALEHFLSDYMLRDVSAAEEEKRLSIDGALVPKAATRETLEMIERAGPFGPGNAEPRFALPRLRLIRSRIVGQNHVSCILSGEDGGTLKAIAFRSAEKPLGQALLDGHRGLYHVAGRLKADDWQGRRSVQLHIDDLSAV